MPGLTIIEVFESGMTSEVPTYSAMPARRAKFPASQQIVTIGSGSGNDLQLPHHSVSHYHAVLVRGELPGNGVEGLLRDLSTTNGTCAPHADVPIDQWAFRGKTTAYVGPYRLAIDLEAEADDWDRVSYSNAWGCTAPGARRPGETTLEPRGPVEPLLERHPSRGDLIKEAGRYLDRTRHRRTILDWLVGNVAHRLGATDSILRINCGRQVFAATLAYIEAPVAAQNAIESKQPFVSDHLLIVPLLEGKPEMVAGDWTLRHRPPQGPFGQDDAIFLGDLAHWILAACPEAASEQWVGMPARPWPVRIAGASVSFRRMMEEVGTAGDSTSRVLLTGPVGSGKTMLAESIHQLSGRTGGFVEVNAATGDPLTAEFLVFGGRLLGAGSVSSPGALEKADKGSLFLDEIAHLPERTQQMLKAPTGDARRTTIRFMRILDPQVREADVRIITATSEDLDDLAAKGKFDPALLSRIRERQVSVPPLAERRDDIFLLAHFFLDGFAASGGEMPVRLSQTAKAALLNAPWKANVRELGNVIEAAYEKVVQRRARGVAAAPADDSSDRGKGASRPEMAPVAEARAKPAGRRDGPAQRDVAARLLGEIQVDDLELNHDAAPVESSADQAPASAREAAIDAVLTVLRDVNGEKKKALARLGTSETTLNQTLDNWCIPREYGQGEPNFSADERNEMELVQATMSELAEPMTRWGMAPKDLWPFYERVMARLAADHGIAFGDVEAFTKRLDRLRIARHFPSSTEEVRDHWRQRMLSRAESRDEQRRRRRKPLPPKDPGAAQADSVLSP